MIIIDKWIGKVSEDSESDDEGCESDDSLSEEEDVEDNSLNTSSESTTDAVIDSISQLSMNEKEKSSHNKSKKSSSSIKNEFEKQRIELECLNILVHLNDEKTLQHTLSLPSKIRLVFYADFMRDERPYVIVIVLVLIIEINWYYYIKINKIES